MKNTLTDEQSYEIAQKFYGSCYMLQDDSLAIGAKAIPLIFDECLKALDVNLNNAKVMPADECIEKWWAEGRDNKSGFWDEAPYRTNGDVIEEIKTAVRYFIETWQK
jgi:hypothetical protein